jgi:hypothetical protein
MGKRDQVTISAGRSRAWISGGVSCLVLLGLAVGALGTGVSAAFPAAAAMRPDIPTPGDFGQLDAVWCTSPARCWAVGYYARGSTDFDQVQRWNGRKWALVSAPGRGNNTSVHTELTSVTCVTPASCWAVGELGRRDGSDHNQVARWNGRRWSLVSVPDPGATTTTKLNELIGVSCAARASCWAVGEHSRYLGFEHNEVVHWNGRRWSLASVPDPAATSPYANSDLVGVSCPSRANCWAVGNYMPTPSGSQLNEVVHWNGRKWSRVIVPSPSGGSELFGVSCPSPGSCWAVGTYFTYVRGVTTTLNEALHWNGHRWSLVATPDQAAPGSGNELTDVSCTSPANCWAVGGYGNIFGYPVGFPELNQALHWNGRKWTLVATPDPAGTTLTAINGLNGASCASAARCWAVGDLGLWNEALRWNGSRWSTR